MASIFMERRAAKHCYGLFALMIVVFICPVRTYGFINSQTITVTVPPYPNIKDNAFPIFLRAAQMTEKMKHVNPSSDPNINGTLPIPLRNYALAYRDSLPALKLMESALNKPCLCPDDRSLYNIHFGNYASLRNLARVVGDDSVYQYRKGDFHRSVQISLDGTEMGVMIAHGGGLMSHLVSMAMEAICQQDLEKDIPHLTTSQLEYAEKRFQAIERKRTPFSDIVMEEANIFTTYCIQMLGNPKYQNHWEQPDASYWNWKRMDQKSFQKAVNYLLRNKNHILRENQLFYKKLAAEMRQPYHVPFKIKPPTNLLMKINPPADILVLAWKKYTLNEACDTLEQTETAIYWYRNKTGHFPNTLQQLVPRYLPSIPEDPFHQNKPLIYRLKPNGKGFLLYSVGPDQVDNGGKPMKRYWEGKGDMVAGYLSNK